MYSFEMSKALKDYMQKDKSYLMHTKLFAIFDGLKEFSSKHVIVVCTEFEKQKCLKTNSNFGFLTKLTFRYQVFTEGL